VVFGSPQAMTDPSSTSAESPLTREMVEQIDASMLPSLERHHLRLLSHCLASFQQMASPECKGPIPALAQQQRWCRDQPLLKNDPEFCDLLLRQFSTAADRLESIADALGITPLELTLGALIDQAVVAFNARQQIT